MPGLGDLPVLDVVVGLAFLYFMLSLICSSIAELLASVFRVRAKNLDTRPHMLG